MREFSLPKESLNGSLLIAHPNLLDPNFRRTILFIATHDLNEGTLGLVLNRTTEKKVSDFLSEAQIGALEKTPVFIGGPVGLDQLMFASFRWNKEVNALECKTHLVIEEAQAIASEDPGAVRAFIGHSGWSKGQLEAELAQKAWIVQKTNRELLDTEKCMQMWPEIMRNLGPVFRLLAAAPDDPSLN